MIKPLIILSMVLIALNTQCSNGCLRCQPDTDRCLYCDVESGYVLSFGRCQLSVQDNCAQLTNDGDCLICKEGYYLDYNTYSCVEVPKEVSAENCQVYSDQFTCLLCNQGYYLKNGECVKLSSPITNCNVQVSETECHSCTSGYIPSLDHKSCVSVSSANCLSYSYLECRSCFDGYILNNNYFTYSLLGYEQSLDKNMLNDRLSQETNNEIDLMSYGVCQAYRISNCSIYNTFDTCNVCNSGYLLQEDGTCLGYANERIDSCEKYSSLTTCISCIQGKYLKSSTSCVDNVAIDFCSIYSTTAPATTCVGCQSNYYLLQNKCTARTSESIIANCLTLSVNSETCSICADGYILTGDSKKCLASIANCLTYKATTTSSTQNECIVCVDGYYYDTDSKTCVQGGIENCKTYQTNSNGCAICKNRYYLVGTACSPHDVLDYCINYSASILNFCTLCDDNSYLFTVQNTCAAVVRIEHCETYANITDCGQCEYGYYLSGNLCNKIGVIEHCLRKDGANCIKCDDNYVLDGGACKLPLEILIRNCESHNIDGLTPYSAILCNYCEENSLPINYSDNYLCYENNYIADKLAFAPDLNCLQYKNVSGTYECRKCVKEMYLQNGVCVSSCSGLTTTIYSHLLKHHDSDGDGVYDSFSIESINSCSTTLANCKVATPDLYQPDPTTLNYSCTLCNDSTVPVISLNNEKILLRPPRFEGDDFRLSPVSFLSPVNCASSPADASVIGDLNASGLVDNCDTYYNVDVGSGCLKCKHGFNGIVVDTIFNCKTYTDVNRCSECNDGYYLATAELCKPVLSPISNCKKHSTIASTVQCVECNPLYYLANPITCILRGSSVDNCATYTINADTCSTCATNLWLTANTCKDKIPNCTTHIMNGLAVECTVCADGYFVLNTKCAQGTVTNCKTYNQAAFNTCSVCNNTYYLANNTCSSQSSVTQCSTFGQTKGKCEQCNAGYFLVSANNYCSTVTTITNCTEYSSLTTCNKCADGFYVANDAQRCLAIPASWHCDKYGTYTLNAINGCTKCQDDYLLISGLCKNWYNVLKTNCDTTLAYTNNGQISTRQCTYCASGYESVSFTTEAICLEQDLIDTWSANSGTTKVMTHCIRYEYITGSSSMKCIECESGYVINSADNTCILIADCPTNSEIFTMGITVDTTTSKFTTTTGPFCKDDNTLASPANQKCYYAPETSTTLTTAVKFRCSKCFDGYLAFVNLATTNMVITQGIAEMTSPVQTYISLNECVDPSTTAHTILGVQTLKKLVKNCSYYYLINGTNYGCLACKKGYTGIVNAYDLGGATSSLGYINKCNVSITGCDTSVTYTGIIPNTSVLVNTVFPFSVLFNSCHKCTSATEIPFAFVSGNATTGYSNINGLWEYTDSDLTTTPAIGSGTGYATRCLATTGAVQGVTLTTFPANCALGFANSESTDASSSSYDATVSSTALNSANYSFFCAACKPGYKPNRQTFKEVIGTCSAISNCTVSASWTWLNACQACDSNYAYLYDSIIGIQYDVCSLTNTDSNCLVVLASKECIYCKKGYYLNTSKVCEILAPPKCTTYYNNGSMNYQYQQLGYYLSPKPDSCAACDSGYVLAKNFQNNAAINLSTHIPTSVKYCASRSPAATVVEPTISNCKITAAGPIYYWRYNLKAATNYCITCAATYILTKDGQCVSQTNYANCTVATDSSSNKCEICNTNYASVAGVCKNTVAGGGVITNCQAYADSTFKTGAICTRCSDGYYISNETVNGEIVSQCVLYAGAITNCAQFDSSNLTHIYCTTCLTGYSLLILKDDTVTGVAGYARECISITGKSDVNCSAWDVSKQVIGQLECTICNAITRLPMAATADNDIKNYCIAIPTTLNCAEYDLVTTLFNNKSYNPALSGLKCNKCISTYYLNQETFECVLRTNNAISNCSEYEIGEDKCKSCNVNYLLAQDKLTCTPLPAANTSPAVSIGYILGCREMPTCTQTYYEGLHPYLNAMSSCHKCVSSSQIPFIAVRGGRPYNSIIGLNEYSLSVANNLTDGYDLTKTGASIFCVEPSASNLTIPIASYTFPTNCGMGILNTNAIPNSADATKTTSVNRSKISVFCGACAPGYRATYSTDNVGLAASVSFMIGTCTKIDNCESSVWFNYCSQCSPSYTYAYTEAAGIQYDKCVSYTANQDCHAVDITDSSNYKCKYCNKGSYVNSDGYCERIRPPRCEFAEFDFRLVYDIEDLSNGLYMNKNGTGCQKCEPGFTGIYQDVSNYICTHSEYHAAKKLTASTKYLLNCKKYYINNGLLKCQECYDGYVPIDQTKNCTSMSNLQFCAMASNSEYCKQCQNGYVLVNRKCEKENILNCIDYSNNETSIIQNCSKCAENYYLMANVCILGNITNCLEYETNQVCATCNPGYTLAKQKNGISYCYPINPDTNCSAFDETFIQSGILACSTCISNQFVISTDASLFNPTLCMRYTEIANCLKYDIQNQIGNSTFSCVKCVDNFFVSGSGCSYRSIIPENCATYSINSDTCANCNDEYFASTDGKSCVAYPIGVRGCRTYSDATTCTDCVSDKYLSNNQCIDIATDGKITNCLYYLSATSCQQCKSGYLLTDGVCSAVVAVNCATYTNINACATCLTGYGFQTVDSIKQCVAKNIQFCNESEDEYPFNCKVCTTGYYPLSGICTTVPAVITYCLEYAADATCKRCERGMALDIDNKSCLSTEFVFDLTDYMCYDTMVSDKPHCTSCEIGYYFKAGECTACPVIDGCRGCDPESTSTCLICKTGYNQNEAGKCQANVVDQKPDDNTPTPNSVTIAGIVSVLFIILALFL